MEKYVKMTLSEYDDLISTQSEPSTILQETNKNLQESLTKANQRIKDLEESLSLHSLSTLAKPDYWPDLIGLYNHEFIATKSIKKASAYASSALSAIGYELTDKQIRKFLRETTTYTKQKDGTYKEQS
jgi:hypothetical protein